MFTADNEKEGERTPEQVLAAHIICRAANDATGRMHGTISAGDFNYLAEMIRAKEFLFGNSPSIEANKLSWFWFSLAGINRPETIGQVEELAVRHNYTKKKKVAA